MSQKTIKVKVWDILVRLTHWVVAIGIFANLTFIEEGNDIHEYVGYVVAGLVVLRLFWGFVGTKYARFTNFFPTPSRIKHHLRHMKNREFGMDAVGHNPLASFMIFALWGTILGLGVTGYLTGTDQFWGVEWLGELHEVLAKGLYLLVPLHIVASIVMSYWQKQNLIKSMITGNKTVVVTTDN